MRRIVGREGGVLLRKLELESNFRNPTCEEMFHFKYFTFSSSVISIKCI